MTAIITFVCGVPVGLGFSLTAGGGSVLAIPLLVYVLGLEAHQAICISMLTIAIIATLAAAKKLHERQVELTTAVLIAVPGILVAPLGAWLNQRVSHRTLLILFAVIILTVAVRMFCNGTNNPALFHQSRPRHYFSGAHSFLPGTIGAITGLLAGFLGIGGGFVIVPSLALLRGMQIHRAIATAFLSLSLIGTSATASHFFLGQRVPLFPTLAFAGGGVIGLFIGVLSARKLGLRLQKIFAVFLASVALVMLARNFLTL